MPLFNQPPITGKQPVASPRPTPLPAAKTNYDPRSGGSGGMWSSGGLNQTFSPGSPFYKPPPDQGPASFLPGTAQHQGSLPLSSAVDPNRQYDTYSQLALADQANKAREALAAQQAKYGAEAAAQQAQYGSAATAQEAQYGTQARSQAGDIASRSMSQQFNLAGQQERAEAGLQAEAERRRLTQLPEVLGALNSAFPNSSSSSSSNKFSLSPEEKQATDEQWARAKDKISRSNRAAVDALLDVSAGSGLAGSGIEQEQAAGILSGGNENLSNFTTQQAMSGVDRARQIANMLFQEESTRRGQNISAIPSIMGLLNARY